MVKLVLISTVSSHCSTYSFASSSTRRRSSTLKAGAAAGAVAGTALGVPVVGTVIGALSGAAIGAARKQAKRISTRKAKGCTPACSRGCLGFTPSGRTPNHDDACVNYHQPTVRDLVCSRHFTATPCSPGSKGCSGNSVMVLRQLSRGETGVYNFLTLILHHRLRWGGGHLLPDADDE